MNEDIYGIKKWGDDILEIIENGNIGLKNPFFPQNPPVDLIQVIQSLNKLFELANAEKNQGLMNFVADRLDIHAKHGWMIRSLSKSGE